MIIAVISPYSFELSAIESLYFSDLPYQSRPSDSIGSNNFEPRIEGGLEFSYSIPFVEGGRGESGIGELVIGNADGALDDYPTRYAFSGRQIAIYDGEQSDDYDTISSNPIFVGVVSDIALGDSLRIRLGDVTEQLNREIQPSLILSGPNAGKPIPLAYGEVFNVSPVLVDANNLVYQWHDGPVYAVDEVRDNQVLLTAGADYSVDNSAGTITLSARPVGAVTLSGRGALYEGSYVSKAGEIATAILVDVFGGWALSYIDSAALAAIDSDRPYTLGLYLPDRANLLDTLDSLFNSVGAGYFWDPVAGHLTARAVEFPAGSPAFEFDDNHIADDDGIEVELGGTPKYRSRVGWGRNWTVQSADSLAASITDPNIGDAAQVARVGSEYQTAFVENSYVTSIWPSAVDGVQFDTLIAGSADALTEAERRGRIEGGQVIFARVKLVSGGQSVMPGDVVKITSADFGFAAGRLIQVLDVVKARDVVKSPMDSAVKLRGWFTAYDARCAAYYGLVDGYSLDLGTACGADYFTTTGSIATIL